MSVPIHPRIEKGVEILDGQFPRSVWTGMIDLDRLDLSNSKCCVLGQVFGDYFEATATLFEGVGFWEDEAGFDLEPQIDAELIDVDPNHFYDTFEEEAYKNLNDIWYGFISAHQ